MVIAFSNFETIEQLPTLQEKHRAWLKDYEGLNFSIAENEVHKLKWATEPKQYKDKFFSPSQNCIAPRKDRLIIEFEPNGNDLEAQYKQAKDKLKELGAGYLESTHKGKSNYIWVEFTRNLTESEKKRFLSWIAPIGSIADINFCYEKKVFQVLYAIHWRHSENRELPVEYSEGEKIDFDKLNIPRQEKLKTTKTIKNGFEYETAVKEEPTQVENLVVRNLKDFQKIKKEKRYIVQDFITPGTINMIYSPPASFKSLLAESLGICVATGKEWLKQKTKKNPVLLLEGENNDTLLKERFDKILYGLNVKRRTCPFNVIKGGVLLDDKKNVNLGFFVALQQVIEHLKIKVLIFDTLHRFCFYDENKSDDINKLYVKIFQPLAEQGLTIIFLHHSTKKGEYRGSGDFLGMVDNSYCVVRQGMTNKFRIVNEKCRSGEIKDILGEIDFGEDYTKFIRMNEVVEQKKEVDKLKEVTNRIKTLFKPGAELKRKQIIDDFTINEIDFGAVKTIDRSLDWLVENQFLDKIRKGVYTLIRR